MTMDSEQMMADMMRKHMPGIKTQAQYDAVMTALEATKEALSAILAQDTAREAQAMMTLSAAFEVARKATELREKLGEVPDGAVSDAAAPFRDLEQELKKHSQFDEVEIQLGLLRHLETITTYDQLTAWYASTKEFRDQVKTQSLRNELMDTIRAKKSSWCVQCRNPHFDGQCECGKA